ncbi:hypothetical protein [Marinicella meishanensis]|uniref:hypothetical protein n=1 Tax=Marinicella meishanensis TaxID=2873263 RepID=UPI001CC05256|nr:hypothetical protein [Marinicella sp. NBU2979]
MTATTEIEHIRTEVGNQIIADLKQTGWRKTQEYSPLAFDKGIDYDSLTLTKGAETLEFEWSNWFEWSISGPADRLQQLQQQYALK